MVKITHRHLIHCYYKKNIDKCSFKYIIQINRLSVIFHGELNQQFSQIWTLKSYRLSLFDLWPLTGHLEVTPARSCSIPRPSLRTSSVTGHTGQRSLYNGPLVGPVRGLLLLCNWSDVRWLKQFQILESSDMNSVRRFIFCCFSEVQLDYKSKWLSRIFKTILPSHRNITQSYIYMDINKLWQVKLLFLRQLIHLIIEKLICEMSMCETVKEKPVFWIIPWG